MDGKTLKLKRIDADVKAKDVAQAMGVTPGRVSAIENSRVLTEQTVDQYLRALATLTTTTTSESAVA